MSLAVSQWTGNSHEVSGQFTDDRLDFLMGGLAKDMCENGMRHLCLNVFVGNGVRSHCLGGMGRRSAKRRCLVGSNDNTDDANEKSTGCSVTVLSVRGNVGNGHAADDGNGAFNCRFCCNFEVDFRLGMR
jgi:hypothetical protein